MARITVEDCLDNVANRFQLVLIATTRARQIARGAKPLVEEENDKPTVLALREIAAGYIDASILDEDADRLDAETDELVAELQQAEGEEDVPDPPGDAAGYETGD